MFEEVSRAEYKERQEASLAKKTEQLSAGVFFKGAAKFFVQLLRIVRLLEAFYLSLVLLIGVSLATMVLGPQSVGLHFAFFLPPVCTVLLSSVTLKEFAFIFAVCHPELDLLIKVEHDSRRMMRDYIELRAHFVRMFTLTNPGQSIEVTCEEQFRKADTDSGGSLSYKEFGALVDRVTGEKKLPKAALKRLLRAIDTDQQGHITLHEFLKFVALDDPAAEKSGNGGGGGPEASVAILGQRGHRRAAAPAPAEAPAPAAATPYAEVTAYAEAYEAGGGSPDAKEVRVSFAPAPAMATEAAPAPAMAEALSNARPRSPETEMNPLAA